MSQNMFQFFKFVIFSSILIKYALVNSAGLDKNANNAVHQTPGADVNIHDVKLNHIAQTLTEMKGHLTDHQVHYIEPIQRKINGLVKILDVFRLFHAGAPINGIIIANNVKIKPNKNNVIARIFLNGWIQSNETSISTLIERLKAANFNLRCRIVFEHQIKKRSTAETNTWSGHSLHINKLKLIGQAEKNFKPKILNERNAVHRLHGKLSTKYLVVKHLERIANGMANWHMNGRTKRSTTLSSLDHSKIVLNSINNIKWSEFVNTVYRKGMNTTIVGNIVFEKPAHTTFLNTAETNGIRVFELMTMATDQVIQSNAFIRMIFANHVNVRIFNDMRNFADNVVLLGTDAVIESRVKVNECHIRDSLHLSDDESEHITDHIVGTHLDDLVQIYHGRVLVRGSVNTNNISVSNPDQEETIRSQILINGILFDLPHLSHQYWMKTVNQDIPHANFNEPITSPQATINRINGFSRTEYFILDDQIDFLPLNVDFQDVKIKGNLFTDKNSMTTLQKLNSDSIARLGNTQVIMNSSIIFKDRLLVNHMTLQIDSKNLVRKSLNGIVSNSFLADTPIRKQFKQNLHVTNNIIPADVDFSNFTIHNYNNYTDVSKHLNSVLIPSNKPSPWLVIVFETKCNAHSMDVQHIKHRSVPSYDIQTILQSASHTEQHRIQKLTIEGNIQIVHENTSEAPTNPTQITQLNGLDLNKYLQLVVFKQGPQQNRHESIEIGGEKGFMADLNIASVHTFEINKRIQTENWLESVLRQQPADTNQQIIESMGWQFNEITSDNLQMQHSINGIGIMPSDNTTDHIIFVNHPHDRETFLTINSDISLSNNGKIGSNSDVTCTELRPCNVDHLQLKTVNLPQTTWDEIKIFGNVKVLSNDMNADKSIRCTKPLCYLQMSLSATTNEIINENIDFNLLDKHDTFSFNKITSRPSPNENVLQEKDVTQINSINLVELVEDSLTRTTVNPSKDLNQTQLTTFSTEKELLGTENVFDASKGALLSGIFSVNLINDVNVNALNNTLYLRSKTEEMLISPWQKLVFLDSPSAQNMQIDNNQTINGVGVDDVFFAYSPVFNKNSSMLFEQNVHGQNAQNYVNQIIADESFNTQLVNGISLEYFINNRCKLSIDRFPHSAVSHRINKPQIIDGSFTFENLVVSGNDVKIEQINDVTCDEIVLTHSTEKQQITGFKVIDGNLPFLYVEKPFHVWKTNNHEFVSMYAKTILLNHKQSIGRLIVKQPFQIKTKTANISRNLNEATLPKD
ncbi:uncharacterized protein LOC116350528 [Contarinia nasturtii]|uniref:uncharacterized protein LOC116350528 n=1 Tax=Contarinia nasturtii TaxID=265458 RepID=UPI0012D37474|nr:uncharacterized protein LOC116350528 [Contarinia nasturtii]